MKKIGALIAVALLVFVFVSTAIAAEYKVYVTRLDDNLYQDRNSRAIRRNWGGIGDTSPIS